MWNEAPNNPAPKPSNAAPCSAFMAWFNESPWAGAGKDAGELAQAAWNAAIRDAAEIYWHHTITIRKTGIGDSQIMFQAIKSLEDTPNDELKHREK